MPAKIQIQRNLTDLNAPTADGAPGELAIGFKGTQKPALWASKGGHGWLEVNPSVTVSTQSIPLGAAVAGGIGAAYTTWIGTAGNTKTGNVVIATYGTPAEAYLLTNATAPGTSTSWTSLGGAVAYADALEIHAGTDTTKALNSAILRGETVNAPTGGAAAVPGDADKLIRLNGAGQINKAFVPFSVQHENLGGTGADVGAAWAAATKTLTGEVVLADFGTPAKTYILVNRTAPGAAASWTLVGGAIDFADADDVKAGTDKVKALNSFVLQDTKVAVAAPTGAKASATDAGKLVRLDTNGQLSLNLMPAMPTNIRPALDVTTAFATATPPYKSGDLVFNTGTGAAQTVGTGWTNAAGKSVKSGDALLYDGTNWHVIPNETDLNDYVPKAGPTTLAANVVWTFAPAKGGDQIIDAAGGKIDNVVIDCGEYT